jgi:nucleoside permease NupC
MGRLHQSRGTAGREDGAQRVHRLSADEPELQGRRTLSHFLSPRGGLLATYALCGFANFASVGIQIGGISVLAPSRRADLSRIGLLAMFGGAIATLMAACVVGVLM